MWAPRQPQAGQAAHCGQDMGQNVKRFHEGGSVNFQGFAITNKVAINICVLLPFLFCFESFLYFQDKFPKFNIAIFF